MLAAAFRAREFLDEPRDRYLVGECWIAFCVGGVTAGVVLWGAPRATDIAALIEVMPLARSPLAARQPRYLDIRRLAAVEQPALARFADYLICSTVKLDEITERSAVVHAAPLGAALVGGLPALVAMKSEVRGFVESRKALEWLGVRRAEELATQLDDIQTTATGVAPLIRDVRTYCAEHLADAGVTRAAVALGMSSRGLQRKLSEHATSFQNELNAVRVAEAKRLLADTDANIADIARRVGCGSPQHFSTMFRRLTKQAPSEWRGRWK